MNVHPCFKPFDFQNWIENNRELLKPPVGNKLLFEDDGMIVMIVGGPNTRVDFHDDPVQEFFYQLKGDMVLKIAEDGDIYDVPIGEGDVFMLPPHTPHSPQRPVPGSVGLVVESPRMQGMRDGFEWYCFNCKSRVHRVEIPLGSIVTDLPPLFEAFYADEESRRCPSCNTVHPGKGDPPEDWVAVPGT